MRSLQPILGLQFFWEMQPQLILQYYVYKFCDTQSILKLHKKCLVKCLIKAQGRIMIMIPRILNNPCSVNVGHVMFVLAYDV